MKTEEAGYDMLMGRIKYLIKTSKRYKTDKYERLVKEIEDTFISHDMYADEQKFKELLTINKTYLQSLVYKWNLQIDNVRNNEEHNHLSRLIKLGEAVLNANVL